MVLSISCIHILLFGTRGPKVDDASTVLDESGSLGSFLDATIARAKLGHYCYTC
jgi:hypothetical protein